MPGNQRKIQINQLSSGKQDILIIGGGINGASCAASLAATGMKVCLVERGDFASETSQASSNLIWGGIKYLQSGCISLVNKLCRSRNILIQSYPSSVREIRYFTTLQKTSPSRLLFYLGTWVYWFFGRCFTMKPRLLSPVEAKDVTGGESVGGVEYSDAYLPDNDARFTFQFIRAAWNSGALAINYMEAVKSVRGSDQWMTTLRDLRSGAEYEVKSDIVLNAAGPMVDEMNEINRVDTNSQIVFSKGVHLIVPSLTKLKKVMTFFAEDGRLFFAIPMESCTCIGTTDTSQEKWASEVTQQDIDFILDNINAQMGGRNALTKKDVIATRCGVRPLAVRKGAKNNGDWMKLSRKHVTEVDKKKKYISIYGGKLTDCVNVGNELREICLQFGYQSKKDQWYGEDTGKNEFLSKATHLKKECMDGIDPCAERLWRRYGKASEVLLAMIEEEPDLEGEVILGSGVFKAEVKYAAGHEMVVTLEDFLRRRTNLSLCQRLDQMNGELSEIAETLFGEDAGTRLTEYFKAPQKTNL
jgi:glycerol-3-phosphate dehydrogenase